MLKDDQNQTNAKFIAFTEQASNVWEIRKPCCEFGDPNRNAKIHKILSHRYFPDDEITLWIDGSLSLISPVDEVLQYLGEFDLAVFAHPTRNCCYLEAKICIKKMLDDPQVIKQQMCRYQKEGYPKKSGLVEAGVLLRKNNEKVREFNEMWWDEIQKGSRRDQISFNYCAKKTKLNYRLFPGFLTSRVPDMQTHMFKLYTHLQERINEKIS